jgi:hypothetical protein
LVWNILIGDAFEQVVNEWNDDLFNKGRTVVFPEFFWHLLYAPLDCVNDATPDFLYADAPLLFSNSSGPCALNLNPIRKKTSRWS